MVYVSREKYYVIYMPYEWIFVIELSKKVVVFQGSATSRKSVF